jgi:uncharacterized heparinase superfamily protein
MILPSLERLRKVDRAELSFRLRTITRTHAQRLAVLCSAPRWDRRCLRATLSDAARSGSLGDAIERQDWDAVHEDLATLLYSRPARFVLDPRSRDTVRDRIAQRFPNAVSNAVASADRLLNGEYDLLGYESLSFSSANGEIDWHWDPVHGRHAARGFWADVPYLDPATGDHKVIWELNRHQHWLAFGRAWWLSGEPRFADAIIAQLVSWMTVNPPLTGVNWASMLELGFRTQSWLWALHFLLSDARYMSAAQRPWLVDLILGLDRQLTHIEQNLSYYFSPNTHLTGEALALYVAGVALPELAQSARRIDISRRVLMSEIDRQIGRDGGHAERSTHYHRYTLEFYLLALLTAERAGDEEAAAAFGDAVHRLATAMRTLADDRGLVPQIGDDDGGMLWPIAGRQPRDVRDALAHAAVVLDRPELAPWGVPEETFWIAGASRNVAAAFDRADEGWGTALTASSTPAVETTPLDDMGYIVVRNGEGDHLVFDVGPHGYLNGGHAHSDALSVTLGIGGMPLLLDPGTVTYTMDPALRDRMRSSALHNTVTIDGRSAAQPAGPFHWRRRNDAALDALRRNAGFTWVEGRHDGYAPLRHRRSIVHVTGRGWLIVDHVSGDGACAAATHWHFDPAWHVFSDSPSRLCASTADGRRVWLLHDSAAVSLFHGDEESGLGWCSYRYGARTPTCTARIERTGAAPVTLVTWIGEGDAPSIEQLKTEADPGSATIATRIADADTSTVTLLRPGDSAHRDTRTCMAGAYHTDARLLQYSSDSQGTVTLAIADATHALSLDTALITINADSRLEDLYVAAAHDTLDLWCSAAPPRLTVHGAIVGRVATLRLNGSDRPMRRSGHESITCLPEDWPCSGDACVSSPGVSLCVG